jgi:hypothetical protein
MRLSPHGGRKTHLFFTGRRGAAPYRETKKDAFLTIGNYTNKKYFAKTY